jgi:hypothetical protein
VSGNWLGLKSGENGSSPTRRSGILMDPIVLSGIGMINERKSSTSQGDRLVVEAS